MKSITEQGSTVAQAVQKGWEKAGKPKEFSVKVFQEPTTNFFGFTKEPAKVGIFFDTLVHAQKEVAQNHSTPRRTVSRSQSVQKVGVAQKEPQRVSPVREQQKRQPQNAGTETVDALRSRPEQRASDVSTEEIVSREIWTELLVLHVREWMTDLLTQMQRGHVTFKTESSQYELRIIFDRAIIEDHDRQQQAFRSMSMLLMQSLRHKLRRPLRGFRIIISSL